VAFDLALLVPDTMDVVLLCKGFFTIGAAVNIGGPWVPSFRRQIMNYGSRGEKTAEKGERQPDLSSQSKHASLLDLIASFHVPHTWFTHFYITSVVSSIFWAGQVLTHGRIFNFLVSQCQVSDAQGMTVNQILLAWGFMALQGARRLYECLTLTKPSKSKMWIGLWLVGIVYYIIMGVSVWIEGIGE
jgi:3-oxo-5-alpha-steroid 4-dehydrogenase 3